MLKLGAAMTQWVPSEHAGAEPLALLQAGWEEIVGDEVAANSAPSRIAGATLWVATRSGAWSQQLSLLAQHVLRAVTARLPSLGIEELRFKVSALPRRQMRRPGARRLEVARKSATPRPDSASAQDALARFRADVEHAQDARRSAGWRACRGCGALVAPAREQMCVSCDTAASQERARALAQLLFEAPWLGFDGTSALIDGLQREEYQAIRAALLRRWWGILERARAAGRLSREGRERLVASSYVILRSKLSPEAIMPETVRNVLGDELHELLYGDGQQRN